MEIKKTEYEFYEKPNVFRYYLVETLIVFCGIISINLIFFAKTYRETSSVDATTAAQLGDFIGGYIGTFFALISIVLLYITLKEQRKATTIEKFETKYFELIKMHRENVAEIGIGNDFGKKIFVLLIREFRAILKIVTKISKDYNQDFTQKDIFIISYNTLFFGVGPNSSRILKQSLIRFNSDFVNTLEKKLNSRKLKRKIKFKRNFKYIPFEGHQSRLGHYYRHLYQTICYVDNFKGDIDKYEYVKTIRAQLTTHEQALLFINSLSPMGNFWWSKRLLIKYRFVQNIPFGFFENAEINLPSYFPEDYFEWQEDKVSTPA